MELADQFRGCLLGLAAGDALAAGRAARAAGRSRPTPVTGLMLCVLDSYNERGAFNPQDLADSFVEQAQQPVALPSAMTAAACRQLAAGYHFERAAQLALAEVEPEQRTSADCLARVVPAGLLHYYDDLHLIGESRVVCGITHPAELCKMACVAFNLALQHMLLVGPGALLEELLVFIEPRSPELAAWLQPVPGLKPERLTPAAGVGGALQAALWAALYCTEFEEGLGHVVAAGADPAAGAAAGAMLGARFAAEAIPADWLRGMGMRRRLDHAAQRMFKLSQRASLPEPPADRLRHPLDDG